MFGEHLQRPTRVLPDAEVRRSIAPSDYAGRLADGVDSTGDVGRECGTCQAIDSLVAVSMAGDLVTTTGDLEDHIWAMIGNPAGTKNVACTCC